MKLLHIVPLAALATASAPSPAGRSVHIPLDEFFNNKGFASCPGEAAINPLNDSFPSDPVGIDGVFTSDTTAISYLFPGYNPDPDADDNVVCAGQTIPVPPSGDYFSVSALLTSDTRSTTVDGNLTLLYSDGSNSTAPVRAHAFWWFLAIRRGEITYPFFYTNESANGNASHIYERWAPVEAGNKTLEGVVLPNTTNTTTGRLHLFALSLWEAPAEEALVGGVEVQGVRPTQELDAGGNQLVEVLVNNVGGECIDGLKVSIVSGCGEVGTVQPVLVKRICPGDQKRVNIPVQGSSNGTATVSLKVPGHERPAQFFFPDVDIAVRDFEASRESLVQHEIP